MSWAFASSKNDDLGILTPEQFYDARKSAMADPATRRLMFALLEDSIAVLADLGKRGECGKIAEESRNWIFYSDPRDRFSFDSACETIEFDPDYMRRGVAKYIERIQAGRQEAMRHTHNVGRRWLVKS